MGSLGVQGYNHNFTCCVFFVTDSQDDDVASNLQEVLMWPFFNAPGEIIPSAVEFVVIFRNS